MTSLSESARVCSKCGRIIPTGQADCVCLARPRYWLHSRETILLLCFAGVVVAFAITGTAARTYHSQRRALAQEWHRLGTAELASGKPELALADFRAGLTYGRENLTDQQQEEYELDLAEALAATGRLEESQSYLLDLWQRAPGNGSVNLELARLAARGGDDSAARQYFDGAINGVWEGNSDQISRDRFDARLELYHYLQARGESSQAQNVLLATAAALPPDASLNGQVGQLMLENGYPQPALAEFEQALRIDRRNAAALMGAGLASFDLGDDAAAVRYLEQSSREKEAQKLTSADAQQAEQALALAQMVLAIDPFRVGLDASARAQRTIRSYDAAVARLESCAAKGNIALPNDPAKASAKVPTKNSVGSTESDDLTNLYAGLMKMKSSATAPRLVGDPQLIRPVMDLVFAAETATAEQCGPAEYPVDIALLRIARHPQGGRP
jgi:Tfp pilus assembly protein PilF